MADKMEILNERRFDADCATLFDAFADPEKLKLWWGPHGFTNRIEEFDFRPGGTWRLTMTSSSNVDFPNRWTFEEIETNRRIIGFHVEPVHAFTLEMDYAEAPEGSHLRWRALFDDTEENRELRKFFHAANEQNFDRLAAVLVQSQGKA